MWLHRTYLGHFQYSHYVICILPDGRPAVWQCLSTCQKPNIQSNISHHHRRYHRYHRLPSLTTCQSNRLRLACKRHHQRRTSVIQLFHCTLSLCLSVDAIEVVSRWLVLIDALQRKWSTIYGTAFQLFSLDIVIVGQRVWGPGAIAIAPKSTIASSSM